MGDVDFTGPGCPAMTADVAQEDDVTQLSPYAPQTVQGSVARVAGEPVVDKSLFQILWKRRRVMAVAAAVPVLLGLAYLLVAHRTYTAQASLFIAPAGGHKAEDPSDRSAFLYTQREVITSTPVLAEAIGGPGVLEFETLAGQRDPVNFLRNALAVDVGTKNDLVTVAMDSRDPNEATQLVAAVVSAYSHFQVTQRKALTFDTNSTLGEEKARTDKEVAERTKALQAFSLEHRVTGPETETSSDNDALRTISTSLTQAHLAAIAATARLADVPPPAKAANDDGPDANYSVEDDAAVRQQLIKATTDYDALSVRYPAGSSVLTAAKARVEQLKVQRYAILASIKRAALKQESDLQAFYDAEQKRHIEQRAYAAEYAKMDDERKRLQDRADAMDTRLRDLKVNDEGKMADVSVLEAAHADNLPTGPKKLRVLGLSLVAGCVLGLLSALAWDQFDTRFESLAEIDRWLGLTAVGILPSVPVNQSPAGQALYTYSEPNSAFAHACRGIWTVLNTIGRDALPKTLAVTSASRGDGRTTVACGLAIAMSQYGRKVLLIDADVHSPRLAGLLGVDARPGLADLIAAPNVDASAVRRCTQATIVPNLYLLAGGRVGSLEGPNFGAVLETAGREFDLVIVDTPSAHKNVAARVVAANCQAALMVVRFGHTDCFAAGRVRNDLFNVGANVLGVVLNQPHATARGTGVSVAPAGRAEPRPSLGYRAREEAEPERPIPAAGPRSGAAISA